MTNQSQNHDSQSNTETGNRPTHIVRQKSGYGKNTSFETLGVAWSREDGSLYIKLYGKQVVDGGFYVFAAKDQENGQ
jgi:hypothetical protein